MTTTVVNKYREDGDVSIMRPGPWGNPFVTGRDGNRAEVVRKHAEWIKTQPHLMQRLHELKNKRLICCCKPQACHGDTLAQLADKA